ncbi:MAG: hypothetical protein QW435_00770 [Candidatus Hadarchaeales archaeon]
MEGKLLDLTKSRKLLLEEKEEEKGWKKPRKKWKNIWKRIGEKPLKCGFVVCSKWVRRWKR